jgi:hypothetical protein
MGEATTLCGFEVRTEARPPLLVGFPDGYLDTIFTPRFLEESAAQSFPSRPNGSGLGLFFRSDLMEIVTCLSSRSCEVD